MIIKQFSTRTVEALAEEYARSRRETECVVSTSAAIRAIRTIGVDARQTDRDLANIIAARAIHYGHVVEFDDGS